MATCYVCLGDEVERGICMRKGGTGLCRDSWALLSDKLKCTVCGAPFRLGWGMWLRAHRATLLNLATIGP